MSTSDFWFRRDIGKVLWIPTLVHNVIRAVAAGIVWCLVLLFVSDPTAPSPIAGLVGIPFGYFVIFAPLGMLASMLSRMGVPFAGLFAMFVALFVAVGDPLVWLAHKVKPSLIPLQKPGFFNLRVFIFVLSGMVEERPRARGKQSYARENASQFESDEKYMGRGGKSRSYKREDWLGNEYVEHEDGSRSYKRTDWLGNEYVEHEDGSRSRKGKDFFGNEYVEHEGGSRSYKEKDFFDNEYMKHEDGSRSCKRKDWLGNEYWDHEEN